MRWRRLDVPGTDACELVPASDGWRLEGVAEFGRGAEAARLRYLAEVDAAWRTRRAEVEGTIGRLPLALRVERSAAGEWRIDGTPAPALDGLIDLDLGFTPATNLFPLRRLALAPGEAADAEAAWLDDTTWTFRRLPQRYERRSLESYWYESPAAGYAGLLTVTPSGFVREYPGLWSGTMQPRITLITLGVDDLQRALEFYRDGLGLATKGIVGQEFEHGAVVFFDLQAGLKLALWPRADLAHDATLPRTPPSATEFSLAHNVGSAGEVDAVMAEAERAGATITKRAGPTFWGGYAGYFQDPDGHLWEVAYNPQLGA